MNREPRSEHGSALVMVLILSAVLLLLGSTFLAVAVTERNIAANQADATRAFNLAEAGIEHAIPELHSYDVDGLLESGGVLFTNQSLGTGMYSVTVGNNIEPDFPTGALPADPGGASRDTDGLLVVTSTGRDGNGVRSVQILVKKSCGCGDPKFQWAAFGDTELELSNSAIYGDAGSNANMTFTGAAPKIHGNASAGGMMSDPADYVTGTATEGATPVPLPIEACPTIPWGPAPMGKYTFDAGTGKLTITGAVTFRTGTYYYSEISKLGKTNITVPKGQTVDIYISKGLEMSGGGFINQNKAAKYLQVWGCGTDTTAWTVTGDREAWFTMYAPTHALEFSGTGLKRGSFIGAKFENAGSGNTMYDDRLGGGGHVKFARVSGTWSELFL